MKIIKVGSNGFKGYPVKEVKHWNTDAKIAQANRMRKNPTKTERIVRDMLARKHFRFEFQYLLHGYIADFYFPGRQWIVELDGGWHNSEKDAERDRHLLSKGIKTLRIPSNAVFIDGAKMVLKEIIATVKPAKVKPKGKNRPKWSDVPKLNRQHLPK